MIGKKPASKFRGIEVIATGNACEAARALKQVRVLSAAAPRLPLANCDRTASCRCVYRHFDDRRQGPRRENEGSAVPVTHRGTEWRQRTGRRESDFA